jgi:hypothetical protein
VGVSGLVDVGVWAKGLVGWVVDWLVGWLVGWMVTVLFGDRVVHVYVWLLQATSPSP